MVSRIGTQPRQKGFKDCQLNPLTLIISLYLIQLCLMFHSAVSLWIALDTIALPYISVPKNEISSHSPCLVVLEISFLSPGHLKYHLDRGFALLLQVMRHVTLRAHQAHRQLSP